ncbi:putative ccch zinc finger domain protein [Phaeomoniella chlamydospora]|uniref:Putative ccch zinc finger domain protein n=1 Tax=Phaeomoniella chlamydospora TaxID=158046 RepID=A0A0G2DXJ3_PHACM|nr:putative ccch zinc finger domain protein [Phaeomoniella chlamydospora]
MRRGGLYDSRYAVHPASLDYGDDYTPKRRTSLRQGQKQSTPYGNKIQDVKDDFTAGKGRPQWILSTYGRDVPASLLEGNELSFEELRLRFYELASSGNQQQAGNEASDLWAKAERAMQDVLNNIDNVPKFWEEAEKKHPNRMDLCKMDGSRNVDLVKEELAKQNSSSGGFGSGSLADNNNATAGSNPFAKPSTPSAFGQPSVGFGQPSFGAPAFGKPSQPSGLGQPAFGQPSTTTQPAFGQPSNVSQPTAFGQPAQPQQITGFGQPSGFGKPAFGQPPQTSTGQAGFGQPAQSSGFGQPSFGAPSAPSAFGQPSAPAFGQPSAPAFGQPSAPSSGFGQPQAPASGLGQPAGSSIKSFGRPSQPTSFGQPAFGQPSPAPQTQSPAAAANPFGQPAAAGNPFAAKPSTASPFSAPSAPSSAPSIFGQQAQSSTTPSVTQPSTVNIPKTTTGQPHPLTSKPTQAVIITQTLPQVPSATITITDPNTRRPKNILTTFRGQKVTYNKEDKPCYERPDGKGPERIFFPDGQPPIKAEEVAVEDSKYTDEVVNAWKYFYEHGDFEPGKPMPLVPPKLEWGIFDF